MIERRDEMRRRRRRMRGEEKLQPRGKEEPEFQRITRGDDPTTESKNESIFGEMTFVLKVRGGR